MQDYEIRYYPVDQEGNKIGEFQIVLYKAQNEAEANTGFAGEFHNLLQIYQEVYPGVKSIEILSVKKQEVTGLAKAFSDYLNRERDLDDARRESMSDSELEKEIRDFISENE